MRVEEIGADGQQQQDVVVTVNTGTLQADELRVHLQPSAQAKKTPSKDPHNAQKIAGSTDQAAQQPVPQPGDMLKSEMSEEELEPRRQWCRCRCSHIHIWRLMFSELKCWVGIVPYCIYFAETDVGESTVWDLMLPLVIVLLGVRFVVGFLYCAVESINICLRFPSQVMLVLANAAGWPITTVLWISSLKGLDLAPCWLYDRWIKAAGTERFWELSSWLIVCAVTLVILEVVLQLTLNGLTVKHYEARIQAAVTMYASLRKLFTVARAAEKAQAKFARSSRKVRHKAVQSAAEEAVAKLITEKEVEVKGPSAFERVQASLEIIGGPLQFGAGFRDAGTVEEARSRARRAYHSLLKAQGRSKDEGLSRAQLLKWLCVGEKSVEASIFLVDPLREEDFVTVVERAYKEQRFITASLSSFDVVNAIIRRIFLAVWFVCMIFTLTFLFGVDFKEWILPMITLTISICFVMARLLGDLIQGALFILWIRPFDIGDWVRLSTPGQSSKYDEMVVRHMGLWRTQFVTHAGELFLIQNSVMYGMCISNLNRAQSPAIKLSIQVPSATSPTKVTELVDSIRQYVQERDTEFVKVSLSFSTIDYSAGHMILDISATARCMHQDFGILSGSKTRLLLFIHAYMQVAGIEYMLPMQVVRQFN